MKKKYTAWLIIFLVFAFYPLRSVRCANLESDFYRGNTFYSEGNYASAIEAYHQVLQSGYESGNLYYNLGNNYFKKGELGKAILNYEKAMRLMPRDSDLKANYQYARSLIKGGTGEPERSWWRDAIGKVFSRLTINGLTLFLSVIFTLILLVILAAAYIPWVRKYRPVTLAVLIMIFTASFITAYEKVSLTGKEAVIITDTADVRFEPFDSATTHYTLYEGTKVAIISSRDSWYKVRRHDKKVGWIKSSECEVF